ncbi:hypothetical protein [Thermocoleostomius sinensis]|uniref:Uncharacterized protein n=1 Tax=Thermocoleostomius sinensis A174 TaxID=2016057 RepID=A0A9E8ZF38_9CYAN|nr:hypothetical protein [Thermocoleostomius sinensis]WAL60674.1 hypothetical protein OXH18_01355 [Thermocoleostomius sinensis A174]
MPRTPGWFNRAIDFELTPRTRELEIQLTCNRRRIAEIDREYLAIAAAKPRFRFGKNTIVPFTNPQTGEEEVLLLEAEKAAELMQLQEERACLQKHVDAMEQELARLSSTVSPQDRPDHRPQLPTHHSDSAKLPWDSSDVPLPAQSPDSVAHNTVPSQTELTSPIAGSGFGTFLAFLTAIGLTLLIL